MKRADSSVLKKFLKREQVATLEALKSELGTTSTMTVFRRLKELGYLASYSHRGKYYSLGEVARFDDYGLWSHSSVWFSRYGNLMETVKELVEQSTAGYTAQELGSIVHVEARQPLLKLFEQERIARERFSGAYVYFSQDRGRQRSQSLVRKDWQGKLDIGAHPEVALLSDELKAAIILFFSLLDEKQRRLFAGLEAAKMGHGGDCKMATLLGLDVHTVARGRTELFGSPGEWSTVRSPGGGRKRTEKKHRKSSETSKD
jgi:hypothetical protein